MRVSLCILAALPLIVFAHDGESDKEVKCWSDEFQCTYFGTCIPEYKVCDGHEDCPYGDDEENCGYGCPANYYECEYDGKCIPNSWLCDDYQDCPVYGDDENPDNCNVTNKPNTTTSYPVTTTHCPKHCNTAFDPIDGRCIFVDPFTKTEWSEARYLCQKLESDLVIVDDMQFYSKLIQYIKKAEIQNQHYWVGARDLQEGDWRWVDNSTVHVGAPLWAAYGCNGNYEMEPISSYASARDCGYLDYTRGLYMDDGDCSQKYGAICEHSMYCKELSETNLNADKTTNQGNDDNKEK